MYHVKKMSIIHLWNICVINHGYVPLVVNTAQSFPHSLLITGFCNYFNTTGATSGARDAYPSGTLEFLKGDGCCWPIA
jgi:hypothetical protein